MKIYKKVILLILLFFVLMILPLYVFNLSGGTEDDSGKILVTAHRGDSLHAPENTLESIRLAVEKKSDYVEIDVQETKDGVLVLLHDNNLKRTTGYNEKIWRTSYEKLQTLEAGGWFSRVYDGEPVPELASVLEYCRGKIRLNIELKSNGHNKDIAEKVVSCVQAQSMETECVITSMNYALLKEVKELAPEIKTGYIMNAAYGNLSDLKYADILSVKYSCVDEVFMLEAHTAGKAVHVWTVNNRQQMERMVRLQVDNIITDDPELARNVIAEIMPQSTGKRWEYLWKNDQKQSKRTTNY
ncbi:MAG: glycerophosphodiester phosphodiesterase [Lachnospiraceae bacterium]